MKLHQNMEKIHSGSWTELWGKWEQKGMLLSQSLPPLACTNLPHRACTNLAWEGMCGAPAEPKGLSAAQQLPVHLLLMCLATWPAVSSTSSCQQQVFIGFLCYPPPWLQSSMYLHNLALVAVTRHFPKWQMVLLSTPRAQNMQPCLESTQRSLSWSTVKNEAGSSTVLTAQLQEKFWLHCVNNFSTKPLVVLRGHGKPVSLLYSTEPTRLHCSVPTSPTLPL